MTLGESVYQKTELGTLAIIERATVDPTSIRGGTRYVGLEHIADDGTLDCAPSIDPGDLRSTKFAFTEEHVLYGKLRPYLRKVARPTFSGVCSTDVLPIRPGPDLDRDFLFHYLRQPSVVSLATARSDGVNLPRISPKTLLTFPISLPPLAEQRRIAAMLDKADGVRRKRREAIRLVDEFLRSVFLEMFGDPVRNEKGWPKQSLGELLPDRVLIVDGPFGSSLKPDSYVHSGVRVVRNFNIHDDYFDDSAFKYVTGEKFQELQRSEVRTGDVLISTKGTLGNVCLMPDLPGQSLLSATGTVRVRLPDESVLRRQFLVSQMISTAFKRYIKRFEAGTNQKYLNLSGIRRFEVILPPMGLQDRYCELRNSVVQLAKRCWLAATTADTLFDSLTEQLFGVANAGMGQGT